VRSIKESCLERMILFGEASVRKATAEFVAHYHLERNHQGLYNRLISPESLVISQQGDVARHERLGGLLNYYYRRAAQMDPSVDTATTVVAAPKTEMLLITPAPLLIQHCRTRTQTPSAVGVSSSFWVGHIFGPYGQEAPSKSANGSGANRRW
jgi:hypothetical protein